MSLPGTIAAQTISKPIDPQEEFGSPSTVLGSSPLVYYYGYASPFEFSKLYKRAVTALGESVLSKLKQSLSRKSGLIINTPSHFVEASGSEILHQAIQALQVNVLLVLGQERLYSDLVRKFPPETRVSVVKLSKSGGVRNSNKDSL
jgi:polyribonucleotide 5'-hydroxyl-kinase